MSDKSLYERLGGYDAIAAVTNAVYLRLKSTPCRPYTDASTAHMAFTRAVSLADTMYLMPFDYLRLPQVAFLGWALFGEPTDIYTWSGAAIIAVSSIIRPTMCV